MDRLHPRSGFPASSGRKADMLNVAPCLTERVEIDNAGFGMTETNFFDPSTTG
jgi:hypothetical protein